MKKLLSNLEKFRRENFEIILFCLGLMMTVIPFLTPDQETLAVIVRNNGSYLSAVSFSKFLGVRYGIIICVGLIILAIALYLHFKGKKQD